jgi:hypothetical protein
LFSAISDVASSAVDNPVRSIVEAVLDERGFVERSAFDAARSRLDGLESKLSDVTPRVEAAEQRASHLADEVRRFQSAMDDLQQELATTREQATRANARAEAAEGALAALQTAVESLPQASGTEAPAEPSALVGPAGEVEVKGQAYVVDKKHAGQAYTIAHNGAVRVGRRLVKKQKAIQS